MNGIVKRKPTVRVIVGTTRRNGIVEHVPAMKVDGRYIPMTRKNGDPVIVATSQAAYEIASDAAVRISEAGGAHLTQNLQALQNLPAGYFRRNQLHEKYHGNERPGRLSDTAQVALLVGFMLFGILCSLAVVLSTFTGPL